MKRPHVTSHPAPCDSCLETLPWKTPAVLEILEISRQLCTAFIVWMSDLAEGPLCRPGPTLSRLKVS